MNATAFAKLLKALNFDGAGTRDGGSAGKRGAGKMADESSAKKTKTLMAYGFKRKEP